MIYRKLTLMLALAFCITSVTGQKDTMTRNSVPVLTAKDSVVSKAWIFTVGINIVDDSGDAFNDFTTIKDQWNMVPYPSRISLGRYFANGLGLEVIGTYNRYREGNTIDGITIAEDIPYYAIDTRLSYDLNKLVGETGFFDPYLGVGLGYVDANEIGRGTYNAVLGFRIWFNDTWGLDLNSSGKWSFGNEASNHIQHAAGLAYRFGIEKELSKKGLEKLALLRQMEQEQQRIQDSIAAAEKAEEEARLLAERLEREKESARLAAEEKAKQEAENARRKGIENAIQELGFVYFDLNSSFLNEEERQLLDNLSAIMEVNPGMVIMVTSHTDSRGSDAYNLWLSERRANRTADYLIAKGIETNRVLQKAFGEEKLTNECEDGVYCTEQEHSQNRRSEFKVVEF